MADNFDFAYQVTYTSEGGWDIKFGDELPENVSDEAKLYGLARMLGNLATRLAGSSIGDEVEDDWEDEE